MSAGDAGTGAHGRVQIVDCDIHPSPTGGLKGLRPYMTRAWQERFDKFGEMKLDTRRHPLRYPNPSGVINRRDATPPGGGEPGSDPAFLSEDLFDRWKLDYGILVPTFWVNAWTDPRLAAAFVAAQNDHFIYDWLPRDPRFKLAIGVSPHDPVMAAEEIRRHADRKGVVAVFLPLINILLGHRYYHPIYDAAQECGLPVVLHPAGAEGSYIGAATHPGGIPATYAERNVTQATIAQSNFTNLIYEGVFERFPRLTIVFIEWGFSWVPPLLWRMDTHWQRLRIDIPWVKRTPTEYMLDHVRFTTQPVDEPANPEHLLQIIEMMQGKKTLLFSTDYPHWDNDDPFRVLTFLPPAMRQAVYAGNALEAFGRRF